MNEERTRQLIHSMLTEGLGLDLSDPNLTDTPRRIAKMYCREIFQNVGKEFDPTELRVFPNERNYDQIIMSDAIFFASTCSHHFLPFTGKAWVLYIPSMNMVGLSKLTRLVEFYAQRPQLQEALCHDIITTFDKYLVPKGSMVVLRAEHGCMKCRGVRQHNGAGMITSAISGCFTEASIKQEGLDLIKLSLLDRG